MLVQFKVGNFLSFKDEITFSMVGYPAIKEHENDESHNIIASPTEKIKLLKSSVFYGANNSGKSNFLSAINFFKNFIINSSKEKQATDNINVIPFLLSSEMDEEPSSFEMTFFINEIRYRYGFEVDKEEVHAEWLFTLKSKNSAKETTLFTREYQEIKPNNRAFKEGKGLEDNTRPNALFLSTVAQLNGTIANEIIAYFVNRIEIISGLNDEKYTHLTINKFINEPKFKKQLIEFFKAIDIGFEDIEIIEVNKLLDNLINYPDDMPEEVKAFLDIMKKMKNSTKDTDIEINATSITINFLHNKFDDNGNFQELIALDFALQSKGTQKLFNIFGHWIEAIENNKILIIDELDTRLHTALTAELIKIFHSNANTKAQLIFASHDTNLLKKELFRRDQIWFTEKDKLGATDVYSLVEYKVNQTKVRNDASFEKDYLLGKYGAIPFLGNIRKFINDYL